MLATTLLPARASCLTGSASASLRRVIAERTMGFSGAGLQGLLNEAALLAARERAGAVSALHLTEGIERVAGGIQRLGTVVPLRERLTVACHECGHAIVGAAVAMAVNQLQDQTEKEPWLRDTLQRARERQARGPPPTSLPPLVRGCKRSA